MDYVYMVTGDRLIISLNSELDHHLADEMRDVIDGIIDNRGVKNIIFDMQKTTFMDSAGIGLMMGRYKKIMDKGKIYVVGADDNIKRILQLSGLYKIVNIKDDIVAAARDMGGNSRKEIEK